MLAGAEVAVANADASGAAGSLLGLITLLDARPDLDAGALADQYAVRILRGFGLSKGEAAWLASRPLPDITNLA